MNHVHHTFTQVLNSICPPLDYNFETECDLGIIRCWFDVLPADPDVGYDHEQVELAYVLLNGKDITHAVSKQHIQRWIEQFNEQREDDE